MVKRKQVVMQSIVIAAVLCMVPAATADMVWVPLENYEGYSDTTDMLDNAPLYMWAGDGGTATYTLTSATANSGSQSVYCKLSPAGWGTWNVYGLRYDEGNGINLLGYDKLSLAMRGSSANDSSAMNLGHATPLRVQVADRFGNLIVDQAIDVNIVWNNDWTTITIDIDGSWNWGEVRWIGVRLQRTQYHNPDIWLDDFQVGYSADYFVDKPDTWFNTATGQLEMFWQLSETKSCTLEWGLDETYSQGSVLTNELSSSTHVHEYVFAGNDVLPNQDYFYRITPDGGSPVTGTFKVPYVDTVLEDFESYTDTAHLEMWGPKLYLPSSAGSTAELNLTDSFDGSKSVTFIDADSTQFFQFGFEYGDALFPMIDMRGYDFVRVWYKGDPGNENFTVNFRLSGNGAVPLASVPVAGASKAGKWSYCDIPIAADDTVSYDAWGSVKYIFFGGNKVTSASTFLFHIDRIELIRSSFVGTVKPYLDTDPTTVQLDWVALQGRGIDSATIQWGIDDVSENQMVVSGTEAFTAVLDVQAGKDYQYQIDMELFSKTGTLKTAYPTSATWVIEDFESYEVGDPNVIEIMYTASPTPTFTLEAGDSLDGSQSVKVSKTGYPDYFFAGFDYRTAPLNLLEYDKLRLWYRGQKTNPVSGASTGQTAGVMRLRVYDIYSTGFVDYTLPGRVAVVDGWTCVEYDIDGRWQWGEVGMIVFHIRKSEYGTAAVWLDRLEAVKAYTLPGDFDGDLTVDAGDLSVMIGDWLEDSTQVPEQSVTSEDFEDYTASPTRWDNYYNEWGYSMITLLDSPQDAYEGSKALRWDYDVETSIGNLFAEILYTLDTPVDLSQYDKVRIRVKRYLDNSEESSLYIKFLDSGYTNEHLSGKTYIPGATRVATENWLLWEIDLHNLNYADGEPDYTELSDVTNMTAILFGVLGNAGQGRIDMDMIEFVKDPQCDFTFEADLNGDCKVNLLDFAILAEHWLMSL